jgi:CHASE2 domain-containing sensor protein
MFSKPWAWFWTIVVALGSGVATFFGALELELGYGWAIAGGLVVSALWFFYCATFLTDRAEVPPSDESKPDPSP